MAEEKRPVTTLLIGLGGSGAWTVVHVKRQLFDAYDNRVPDNIALAVLDTAKSVIVGVGSGDKVREPGMGTGRTELDRSEVAHVGGDAYDLMREIDETDNYPHIKSWLLSKQFLQTLPRAMFNIDQGAGQFRQFGRMAMFRDVMAPATSSVANIIDNKLRSLNSKRKSDDPAISVVITGSLAGGTGAGMFIDVAHLVTQVAQINNINVTVRGFLYMPQAFASSLSPVELEPAKGRAYAALRELKRFILNDNYQYGYPMYYHSPRSGVNQALWRADNKGKLFDFVYLIDGEGDTRMNNRKLEDGSASAVADAIMAFLDEHYGPKHEQYIINTRGKIQDRQGEVGRKAFVSTLGAYSIILPIQQIVEGWAYRLSRELMGKLLPIEMANERGYALKLASMGRDQSEGDDTPRDVVQRISTSKAPVIDHLDPNGRTIVPLPLWEKVFNLYATTDREQQVLRKLSEYQLVDWLEMLVPPQSQTDRETLTVLSQIAKVLNDPLEEHVSTSDEIDGGDTEVDWATIRTNTERYVNMQLGQPASGGGRMGGAYREAMARLTSMQVKRFRDYMTSYLYHELNGTGRSDIIKAKTGQFGWLVAVVEEFRAAFINVNQYLNKLSAGANSAATNRRTEVERAIADELRNMIDKKSERRMMPPRNTPAVEAQKGYVDAAQRYVEHYRMEFARDEVSRTLNSLVGICDSILEQFGVWTRVLATHNDSLHNKLVDGENSVRSDRNKAASVANHRLIDDQEWENQRYEEYILNGVRERLFRAWQWQVDLSKEGDQVIFALDVNVADSEGKPRQARKDINRSASNWARDNHDLIMEVTRQVFRDAVGRESVLAYLMDEKDAKALAAELNKNSGFLLSFNINQDTGGYIPGTILLAKFADERPEQREYLREVLRDVASSKNRGDTKGQDTSTLIAESCADPFRLTILSTAELIPMEGVSAYADCEQKYWQLPYDTRQKNHIFPAEVHAVHYEKDLSVLEQKPRALTDRVALLLEDEHRYRNFLLLLAHGMVEQAEQENDGIIETYWRLIAPSTDARKRERGELEEWRLSDAATQAPSLMEAAVQYIIIRHDRLNRARIIPYEHIQQALEEKREIDTADRMTRDEIAFGDPGLFRLYEAFLPSRDAEGNEDLSNWTKKNDDDLLEVAKLIVRHDILLELEQDFRKYVTGLGASAREAQQKASNASSHNEALLKQELYDLFSISIIALNNQIQRHRDLVQDRYDIKTKDRKSRKFN